MQEEVKHHSIQWQANCHPTHIHPRGTHHSIRGPRPANHVGLDSLTQSKHALQSLCLELCPVFSYSCKPEPSSGVAICLSANHVLLHPEHIQYTFLRTSHGAPEIGWTQAKSTGLATWPICVGEIRLLFVAEEKQATGKLGLVHSAMHDRTLDDRTKRTEHYRTLTIIAPGLNEKKNEKNLRQYCRQDVGGERTSK